MSFSEIEAFVIQSGESTPVRLTSAEADELLGNVAYHSSLGDPISAVHFRRSLATGACLHLILERSEATLHLDRFDPHAGPHLLAAHLTQESPRQAISIFLAVAALLRRARI